MANDNPYMSLVGKSENPYMAFVRRDIPSWIDVLGRAATAGPIGHYTPTTMPEAQDIPATITSTMSGLLGGGPEVIANRPFSFATGGMTQAAGAGMKEPTSEFDQPLELYPRPATPWGSATSLTAGLGASMLPSTAFGKAIEPVRAVSRLGKPSWKQKVTTEVQKTYGPWEKGWQKWYGEKWNEIYNRIPPTWRVVSNKNVKSLVAPLDKTLQKEFVSLSPKASRANKILAKISAKGDKSLQIKELEELSDSMWSSLSKSDIQKTASDSLKGALKNTAGQLDNFVKDRMPGLAGIKAKYGEHRFVRQAVQKGFAPWEVSGGRFGTEAGERTLSNMSRMTSIFHAKEDKITKSAMDAFKMFETETGIRFVNKAQWKNVGKWLAGLAGTSVLFHQLYRRQQDIDNMFASAK